jgi:hypothetical protein
MLQDERFRDLIFQVKAAQTWILDRPHSAVSLGDVFRLCGAVKLLLDYVGEMRKTEELETPAQV